MAEAMLRSWLVEPLSREVALALERLAACPDVQAIAVMPDVHLAPDVCNGVALATNETIYPQAVGGDIGCGMAALAFEAEAELLRDERQAARVLSQLYRLVPSNKQASTRAPELPTALEEEPLTAPALTRLRQREGRLQFGTLGRGNHFLEFQRADDGRLWLLVHSGSRAMGQAIRAHHLDQVTADKGGDKGGGSLIALSAQGPTGLAYLADHDWARRYAAASRRQMAERAAFALAQLGVDACEETFFQCDHNHVQRERHAGRGLWVHRKGALAAQAGNVGAIPGSMGTASYHVTGRGLAAALCSSSHGAGRRFSRSEARKKTSVRQLERELRGVFFDHRRARQLCDEAPSAYKEIGAVMRAQRDLTRIVRRLVPVLSYKGV